MKKLICVLITGISFSLAHAQQIGLKGGINYSNIAGDLKDENTYDSKIGFNGGITANFSLIGDRFLSIQPELMYSQKGYNYRNEEYYIDNIKHEDVGKVNFGYLELPVLLRMKTGVFFAEAGPQLSYLVSLQDKTEKSFNNIEEKRVRNISKDDMKELEIGYAAGVGVQANNGLSLGIRYNGSIQHLAKSNSINELTNARHSVLQLQFGFLFGQ